MMTPSPIYPASDFYFQCLAVGNNKRQSYSQLDCRQQIIAFWGRTTPRHKRSSKPIKPSKIDTRQILLDKYSELIRRYRHLCTP